VLLAACVLLGLQACGGGDAGSPGVAAVSDDTKATFEFLVPRGTGELVQRGNDVKIIPNPLIMTVGDVIRIRNQDSVGYTVGPFYVGPNQTMTQIATAPGTFKGMCLLHTGDELVVTIQKA
jgi:hypothetical protein